MARLRSLAFYTYLALALILGLARLEPHLTVRFVPPVISDEAPEVSVTGAVKNPGVYRLSPGARVADALAAAGGASPDADLEKLDLAAPLGDAETVRIPRRGGSAAATTVGTPILRLSVNHATASELETVPGIGPALARRIVAYRPYRSLDDLLRVPGIGPRSLQKLRPYLEP